jgi:hypothetical protein
MQGAGWWLASDGRWYPPDLHPDETTRVQNQQGAMFPRGRDWWLAADGRWYPPELHPDANASPIAPEGATAPRGPGWWLASDEKWYPPELAPGDAEPSTEVGATGSTEEQGRVRTPEQRNGAQQLFADRPASEPAAESLPLMEQFARWVTTQQASAETTQTPPSAQPPDVSPEPKPAEPPGPSSWPISLDEIPSVPHPRLLQPRPAQTETAGQRERTEPQEQAGAPPRLIRPVEAAPREGLVVVPEEPRPPAPHGHVRDLGEPAEPAAPPRAQPPYGPPPRWNEAPQAQSPVVAPQTFDPYIHFEGRPNRPVRLSSRAKLAGIVAVMVVVAVVAALVLTEHSHRNNPTSTSNTPPGSGASVVWTQSDARVVGGPVEAGGKVLAIVTTSTRNLELEALDPVTGHLLWQVPYSASEINAGVPLEPVVQGSSVVDIAPAGNAQDPTVHVEGISVGSGQVLWTSTATSIVLDSPAACTTENLFCVVEVTPTGTTALQEFDATTGRVVATVLGPTRQLAPDLYEIASSQSIAEIGPTSSPVWSSPVSDLFGGSQYSPDSGYQFELQQNTYVGTAAASPNGTNIPLDQYKTVGIRTSDGGVAWSTSGSYQCLGALQVAVPFVCKYPGPGRLSGGAVSTGSMALTLEGINETNGAVTWTEDVRNAQSLTLGTRVAFGGPTSVVVTLTSGSQVVLNLATGKTSNVASNARFWCEEQQMVAPVSPPAALIDGSRYGAATYVPCSASGVGLSKFPGSTPANVGIVAGGMFVWPSPQGLKAIRIGQ